MLWIGGATDAGKSTVAQILAERHGLQVYNYDRRDLAHHQQLAETDPQIRAFLEASLDENWVYPEPEALFQRTLESFHYRFPLVLADLHALPSQLMIVAEGFGLTPELLAPLLTNPQQALWLVPTEQFKLESLARRNKPSFGSKVSDPQRAYHNFLTRDTLLGAEIKAQVKAHNFTLIEVDGSHSADEMATLVETHFQPLLG